MKISTLMLGELYTNCYIVSDEETGSTVVIDPAVYDDRLARALSGKKKVDYVLLTHGHFDHTEGAERVCSIFGAKLAISSIDAEMLADGNKNGSMLFLGYDQKAPNPDVLLSDGDVISAGNISLRVMLTPGHTMGSVCFVGDGVIFSGDTLFKQGCGRCDMYGGSAREMRRSLDALSQMEGNYTVYPGHGNATTLDKERADNPYFRRSV